MAEPDRKEFVGRLIGEQESELRTKRQSEGKQVLGKDGLMKVDTKARPKQPKRGPMPTCLCSDAELTLLFITARYCYEAVYRDLTQAYREAD